MVNRRMIEIDRRLKEILARKLPDPGFDLLRFDERIDGQVLIAEDTFRFIFLDFLRFLGICGRLVPRSGPLLGRDPRFEISARGTGPSIKLAI